MARKKRVLVVCIQNSARSQTAEASMNQMCGEEYEGHSAGLSPGELNPLAVQVMHEIGVDISAHGTQSVFDIFKSGQMFAYVVTVCDQVSAERCPIFPGVTTRLQWSFPDPAGCEGTQEEKLQATREIRDMIHRQIAEFCNSICQQQAA